MKKIIPVVVLLFILNAGTQAQVSTVHLTFKGVPIDGTLDEYVLKMKKSGFMHSGTQDGLAILKGDFASYKNCTVGVSTLKAKDLVNKIIVMLPNVDNWSALASNYFNLKEMLTEKYGQPSDFTEKFDRYSEPRDDGSKMNEVLMDRCKYFSSWQTEKGTIELTIEKFDYANAFVKLAYFDKINGETIKKEALNDL
jgi:hypothetical protein